MITVIDRAHIYEEASVPDVVRLAVSEGIDVATQLFASHVRHPPRPPKQTIEREPSSGQRRNGSGRGDNAGEVCRMVA
jgi:hypothetical protein